MGATLELDPSVTKASCDCDDSSGEGVGDEKSK